jgi:hypothetical protein
MAPRCVTVFTANHDQAAHRHQHDSPPEPRHHLAVGGTDCRNEPLPGRFGLASAM